MYSHDDLKTLHGFLKTTPEGGLKKMLIGGRFSETHLRLLMKVIRAGGEAEFITHFEADTFPKVKMVAAELAIKESFWRTCAEACSKVGLLTATKAA